MNKQQTLINVEAIQLLKSLQQNNRKVTQSEQELLRSFLGWGSIHQVFNDGSPKWAQDTREQLISLLSKEEYRAAQNATINAHYTCPKVVKAIWEGVQALGFKGGMAFEPGCGIGNFIGNQPPQVVGATQWFGVELDPIAAGIAQVLYPEATIYNMDFSNLALPKGMFDLVIGNVPFGDLPVIDPEYANILSHLTDEDGKTTPNIHCYFAMKGLMLVKEGGLFAFITSTGLLDSKGNLPVRRFLAQHSELVGALRLPDTTFKEYAGTQVTTDLIVLRRTAKNKQLPYWVESVIANNTPSSDKASDPDWMLSPSAAIAKGNFGAIAHLPLNSYYLEHPENVLGTPAICQLYGGERSAVRGDGRDLLMAIERGMYGFGVANDPAFSFSPGKVEERVVFIPPQLQSTPVFQYVEWQGAYYERLETTLRAVKEEHTDRIAAMLELYAALDAVIQAQQTNDEDFLEACRAKLNTAYDSFIEDYGYLNYGNNPKVLGTDPRYYLLMSLETPTKENLYSFKSLLKSKSHFAKADIFSKRTARPNTTPECAGSEKEALLYSLNEKGKIDMSYIAQLMLPRYSLDGEICLEQAEKKAIAALTESDTPLVFFDPASEEWVTADEYLSGDVRRKLAIARIKEYSMNIAALEAVQPKFILPPSSPLATTNVRAEVALALGEDLCEDNIKVSFEVRLGTTWIPVAYKQFFANYLLGVVGSYNTVKVHFAEQASLYNVTCNDHALRNSVTNETTWGAYDGQAGYTALELIKAGLNLKDPTVRVEVGYGNEKKSVVDPVLTGAARKQLEKIEKRFVEWLWSDVDRAITLTEIYNERFNCFVLRKYDGSHITLPGANPEIFGKLYPHQKNAIWRAAQQRSVLFHHPVGAGKTFEMIASIMEAKRLGLAHKPMMVVLNSTIDQIASAFKYLYPTANILVADKKSYEKKNRKRFFAQIATGNWDCVIVTYPQFLSGINISAEAIESWFDKELNALDSSMKNAEDPVAVKMLGAAHLRLTAIKEEKIDKLLKNKDDVVFWEQLGVDLLCCDESHLVKNLWYSTKMQGVAGLPNPASLRALDCFLKVQSLLDRGGRVIFATATPISNSMVELWTVLRFLANDFLIEIGIDHFDNFASAFGQMVTGGEVTPDGYKVKKRFSKFFNVAELVKIYTMFADVIPEWKLGIQKPGICTGNPIVIETEMSEQQRAYQYHLYERAMEIDHGNPRTLRMEMGSNGQPKAVLDNKLVVTNNGRQANLDIRLVSDYGENFSGSKLNRAAIAIYLIWKKSTPIKGTQLVFCDFSTPNTDKFNAYHYLKSVLVGLGIPAEEVQFIQSFKTNSQIGEQKKRQLFEDVNNGVVRVLFGGTETLGTGVNVQRRAVACHQIDVPWRPSDVTQRIGRVERTGNLCPEILDIRYITQGFKQFPGFDAYLWGMIQRKQDGFSSVIYNPENTANRVMDDIDPFVASASLLKAMSTGDDRYMKLEDIKLEISNLRMEKEGFDARSYQMSLARSKSIKTIKEIEEVLMPIFEADMKSVLDFPKGIPYAAILKCEEPDDPKALEKAYRDRRTEVIAFARYSKENHSKEIGQIAGFSLVVDHTVPHSKHAKEITLVYLYSADKKVGYQIPYDGYKAFLADKQALIQAIQSRINAEQARLDRAYSNLKETESAATIWEHQDQLNSLEAKKAELEEDLGMTINQEIEDDMGVKETRLKSPKAQEASVDMEALVESSMFDTPDCAPYQEIEPEMVEILREILEDYEPDWLPQLQAIVSDVLAREASGDTASTLINVPLVYGPMQHRACTEEELKEQEEWEEEFWASLAKSSTPVVQESSFETDQDANDYFNEEDDEPALYDVMPTTSTPATPVVDDDAAIAESAEEAEEEYDPFDGFDMPELD